MLWKEFFVQLRRRNVYRAAAAYIVGGGFIVQVLTAAAPYLGIPNALVSAVIVILLLGLPLVAIFSWAFDVTTTGIKRANQDGGESIFQGRKLMMAIVFLAVAATGIFLWQRNGDRQPKPRSEEAHIRSIAVLPFQNLGLEDSDSYLTDALRETIIRRLARVQGLKVISRGSTRAYRSPDKDPLGTQKRLGVTALVEGGVEKASDEIRIELRIIDRETKTGPLSYSIKHSLEDMSALDAHAARIILSALKLSVPSPSFDEKQTTNPAAEQSYLRGLAFAWPSTNVTGDYEEATKAFKQSLKLDPYFLQAWAELATSCAELNDGDSQATARWGEQSKTALAKASELGPESPEAFVATAYVTYLVSHEYEAAKTSFKQAAKFLPANMEIPGILPYVARRAGDWDECLVDFQALVELEPANLQLISDWAYTLEGMRDFQRSIQICDKGLALVPTDIGLLSSKVEIYHALGDLNSAGKILAKLPVDVDQEYVVSAHFEHLWLQRRFPDAIAFLKKMIQQLFDKAEFGIRYHQYQFELGMAKEATGDSPAVEYLLSVTYFKGLQDSDPNSILAAHFLSQICAKQGQKSDARRHADTAVKLARISADAFNGRTEEVNQALVQAWAGEHDRAIVNLERLLTVPINSFPPVTPPLLKMDPRWDSLRGIKRFQAIYETP